MSEKSASRSFRDVDVWKRAHRWVLGVYRFTKQFPADEVHGIASQLRRAATSVPMNFAEGFRKRTKNEKARYYNTAQASLDECEYGLILAQDLRYGDSRELLDEAEEIARMLDGYLNAMLRS